MIKELIKSLGLLVLYVVKILAIVIGKFIEFIRNNFKGSVLTIYDRFVMVIGRAIEVLLSVWHETRFISKSKPLAKKRVSNKLPPRTHQDPVQNSSSLPCSSFHVLTEGRMIKIKQ